MMRSRLVLWVVVSIAAVSPVVAQPLPQLMSLPAHVAWNDVDFVDAQRGWVVGAQGAMAHTTDGGQTWAPVDTGTTAALASVSFVDAQHGWVAGGQHRPLVPASTAVLLETTDGGASWQPVRTAALPALRQITFCDARRGWAVGEPSTLYPSGAFVTDDGGYNWTALPATPEVRWLGVAAHDPFTGLMYGAGGAVGLVRRRGVAAVELPAPGLRAVRCAGLTAQGHSFVAGDGGLLCVSDHTHKIWRPVETGLPPGATAFDWRAMAVNQDHVWLAGSPGTQVLHSADAGRTWQWQPTGQSLPLAALEFIDDRHGWAVGALGTILRTTDGGQTWQQVSGQASRAAVLVLAAGSDDVPWEAVALLGGNEGYHCVVRLLARDEELLSATEVEDRLAAATAAAGGSAAEASWRFPRRSPELNISATSHLAAWSESHGDPHAAMTDELVQAIRVWRPDVVITMAPAGDDPAALDRFFAQAVIASAHAAGDGRQFPTHQAERGLSPWAAHRVYGRLPGEMHAGTELSTAQFAPRLGRTLAEVADEARGLTGQPSTSAHWMAFSLLAEAGAPADGGAELTAGLPAWAGDEARRPVATAAENSQVLLRAAQRTRNLEAILAQSRDNQPAESQLLAQINTLTAELDPARAASVLHRLAQHYHRAGRWVLAAETYELLATQYPQDAYAAAALVWLLQYGASGEAAWRDERLAPQATVLDAPTAAALVAASAEASPGTVDRALAVEPQEDSSPSGIATRAATRLRALDAGLAETPECRFPLAALQRRTERPTDAQRFYQAFRRSHGGSAWGACAEVEAWLAAPQGEPPRPLWRVPRAVERPRLDGRLTDAAWQAAAPQPLASPARDDAGWSAVALAAYDDEFLYLAASCRRASGAVYESSPGPRPRDPDLSAQDAVTWSIDLDRDWTTAYQLTIDHRGWPAENCWGDASWNPTWYVAAQAEADSWQVEAAIPLAELTGEKPGRGAVWAVGVERRVPRVGRQSWVPISGRDGPAQALGLMSFE